MCPVKPRFKQVALFLAFVLLAGACADSGTDAGQPAVAKREIVLREDVIALAWLTPSTVILSMRENADASGEPATLWRFNVDAHHLKELDVGQDDSCQKIDFFSLARLAHNEVAFLRECILKNRDIPHRMIEVLHLSSMTTQRLVRHPIDASAGQMTWGPDATRGFYGEWPNSPCIELFELSRARAERADITISEGEDAWNTNEGGPNREFQCAGLGSASLPAWSPDGQTIAFIATPEAPEGAEIERLDASWNLYFADPEELDPIAVLEGIQSPRSLAWASDSRLLAFGGEFDGQEGTWLFDSETDEVSYLDAAAGSLAWSPSGRELLINEVDENAEEGQLIALTLTN